MKRSLVLLLLPLALAVSGCGASDTLSLDAVAQAADRTAAQKSAAFEMSLQMHLPTAPQPVRMFASGAMDYELQRARMELNMGELGGVFGGATSAGALDMELLLDGSVAYVKLPGGLAGRSGGPATPWLKADLSKTKGGQVGQLSQLSQNPADVLEMLRLAGGVEKRGAKEVRGVATTHYHATIDVRKALADGLDGVPEAEREQLRRALEAMGSEVQGLDSIPVDVFVDAQGAARRLVMDVELSAAGQTMRMVMTMDFFDFGKPVEIVLPPAAQVTDMTGAFPSS